MIIITIANMLVSAAAIGISANMAATAKSYYKRAIEEAKKNDGAGTRGLTI